jgi:hypothetical protein
LTATIRAIRLSKLEQDLLDTERSIKKSEAVINSVKVKINKIKDDHKRKLISLIKKREELLSKITESMFLE